MSNSFDFHQKNKIINKIGIKNKIIIGLKRYCTNGNFRRTMEKIDYS